MPPKKITKAKSVSLQEEINLALETGQQTTSPFPRLTENQRPGSKRGFVVKTIINDRMMSPFQKMLIRNPRARHISFELGLFCVPLTEYNNNMTWKRILSKIRKITLIIGVGPLSYIKYSLLRATSLKSLAIKENDWHNADPIYPDFLYRILKNYLRAELDSLYLDAEISHESDKLFQKCLKCLTLKTRIKNFTFNPTRPSSVLFHGKLSRVCRKLQALSHVRIFETNQLQWFLLADAKLFGQYLTSLKDLQSLSLTLNYNEDLTRSGGLNSITTFFKEIKQLQQLRAVSLSLKGQIPYRQSKELIQTWLPREFLEFIHSVPELVRYHISLSFISLTHDSMASIRQSIRKQSKLVSLGFSVKSCVVTYPNDFFESVAESLISKKDLRNLEFSVIDSGNTTEILKFYKKAQALHQLDFLKVGFEGQHSDMEAFGEFLLKQKDARKLDIAINPFNHKSSMTVVPDQWAMLLPIFSEYKQLESFSLNMGKYKGFGPSKRNAIGDVLEKIKAKEIKLTLNGKYLEDHDLPKIITGFKNAVQLREFWMEVDSNLSLQCAEKLGLLIPKLTFLNKFYLSLEECELDISIQMHNQVTELLKKIGGRF